MNVLNRILKLAAIINLVDSFGNNYQIFVPDSGKEPYPGISPYDVLNYVASGNRMERPPQCADDL